MIISLHPTTVSAANSTWQIPGAILVIAVTVFLIRRWRAEYLRRRTLEKNELERQVAQMEMKALRSQMNPHFIFNAINSIQHYVLTNEKELTNKYLVKFSQLIRNILDLSKQELITLKEELETIQIYVDIESLRFNNAFEFQLRVDEGVDLSRILLPPMLIQPFVENAIWHGLLLSQGSKALFIIISETSEGTCIVIDDNGIGREAANKFSNKDLKRRSLGMDITNDRLGLFEKVFGIPVSYKVDDKKDPQGKPAGTRVILNIKNKLVTI